MIQRTLLAIALGSLLFTVSGCFGGGDTSSEPASDTGVPVEEVASPTAAPEAVAADPARAAAQSVEVASTINSYRLHIATRSISPRGEDQVEIEGAYVKDPQAEEVTVNFQQGDQSQEMAMVMVDGMRYMRTGDMWIQTPDSRFAINELTLITPDAVAGLLDQMEYLGTETIDGRQTDHYRGDKSMIPVFGTAGDTMDVGQLQFAQLDLWIDQSESVVSKLVLQASDNSEAIATDIEISFEYYDFNADITIEPPSDLQTGVATGQDDDADSAAPTTPLGQLLGYQVLLPTGTTVETQVGNTLFVVSTPYTFAEAENFIDSNLTSNGYSLVNKVGPQDGQIIYLFQQGDKVVNITISDLDNGATRLQFMTSP